MLVYIEDENGSAEDLIEAIDFYNSTRADEDQEKRLVAIKKAIEEVR